MLAQQPEASKPAPWDPNCGRSATDAHRAWELPPKNPQLLLLVLSATTFSMASIWGIWALLPTLCHYPGSNWF